MAQDLDVANSFFMTLLSKPNCDETRALAVTTKILHDRHVRNCITPEAGARVPMLTAIKQLMIQGYSQEGDTLSVTQMKTYSIALLGKISEMIQIMTAAYSAPPTLVDSMLDMESYDQLTGEVRFAFNGQLSHTCDYSSAVHIILAKVRMYDGKAPHSLQIVCQTPGIIPENLYDMYSMHAFHGKTMTSPDFYHTFSGLPFPRSFGDYDLFEQFAFEIGLIRDILDEFSPGSLTRVSLYVNDLTTIRRGMTFALYDV